MAILNIECSMRRGVNILFRLRTKWDKYWKRPVRDAKGIPVIINNFNRLEYFSRLIQWLEDAGYKNIYIIDNNSTYPPLLEYYKELPYTIFKLDRNLGQFALWQTIIFSRFSNDYYAYTDPDIIPSEDCPADALFYFKTLLEKYPSFKKAGFGLKIDDLPDHYNLKEQVIQWEHIFWNDPLEDNVYDALIDTTFALYRPGAKGGADGPAIRTAGKYTARHLPWYENSKNLSAETRYYLETATIASSWYATLKTDDQQYSG
jgi:hypothetical protein